MTYVFKENQSTIVWVAAEAKNKQMLVSTSVMWRFAAFLCHAC